MAVPQNGKRIEQFIFWMMFENERNLFGHAGCLSKLFYISLLFDA